MTSQPAGTASPPLADEGDRAPGRRLAIGVFLITVVLTGAGLVLLADGLDHERPTNEFGFPGYLSLFALIYGAVGAIIVGRRPGNRVGILLATMGLGSAAYLLISEAAWSTSSGSAHDVFLWLRGWLWPMVLLPLPLLILMVPGGRLPGRRWRVLAGVLVVTALLAAFTLAVPDEPGWEAADRLKTPATAFTILLITTTVVAPVVRYRRAGPADRRALRPLLAVLAAAALTAPLVVFGEVAQLIFIVATMAVPIAICVTVLRYRLYDIDLIINRAIVYLVLTAIMAGVFAAITSLISDYVKDSFGISSGIFVTLLVVALITPVRGIVQSVVDRYYKEPRDAPALLGALRARMDERLYHLDRPVAADRLLNVAVAALEGSGGVLELSTGGYHERFETGAPVAPMLTAEASRPGRSASISVGARADEVPFRPKDREALETTIGALLDALEDDAPG